MRLRTAAWTLVALIGAVDGACAAPATPEGAQALKAQLARYLGAGPLTVTPTGEAYKVDIDVKAALKGLERFGVTLDPATTSFNAAPGDDGTWHVTSGGLPLLTIKANGQTTSIATNGQTFDGTFDPRIPAFTRSISHYDSISIGTVASGHDKAAPAVVQTRELKGGTQTLTATSPGAGMVSSNLAQTSQTYAQEIVFDTAKGTGRVAVKGGPTTDDLTVDKLQIRALLDLWAFLVAHPSVDAIKGEQAAFKSLLRQAMPLFAHLTQDGTLGQVSVATPIGPVSAHALATHVDLTGLTAAGAAELGLKAEDLVLPNAMLPAWAPALIPTGFDLRESFSGLQLDKAAAKAIDALDLGAPEPLPPDAAQAIAEAALDASAPPVIRLVANHISTPTLDLRFTGEVHIATSAPPFTVTVHGTGLEKATAAIQSAAAGDATAAQAIALLTLVKGYGKAEGKDAFSWVVAGDGTGAITVNGVPLPVGPAK